MEGDATGVLNAVSTLIDVSFTDLISPHVRPSNRVQPPSTLAMLGVVYQFFQAEQIHRDHPFPATMLPDVCSKCGICLWSSAFASLCASVVLSSTISGREWVCYADARKCEVMRPREKFHITMGFSLRMRSTASSFFHQTADSWAFKLPA